MDLVEKYSQVYGSPFLTGVFMWVNAIRDVALYVDWPDCIFYKSDLLYKTHDIFSDLKSINTDTKLYFSWKMPNKMVRAYDDKIKSKLKYIDANKKFNLWVITCMPVTWLLATQYNNIFSDLKKDFIFVPSYTDKFRIDWYSIFLRELAKNMDFNLNKEKKKLNISIIWYLYDRNEWDCIWNIEEIRRILWLIWVKINSIWLDWWKLDDLKNIKESELLVSLPNWLYASKILSKKLWVPYIDLNIPFWLKSTIDFINNIWKKLSIDDSILFKVIQTELKIIKKSTDFIDDRVFSGINYIYWWNPDLKEGIVDIWNYLWMNILKSYSYTWDKLPNKLDIDSNKLNLLIWNSDFFIDWLDYKKIEFWFPSYNTHYLLNRPYMWFKGFLIFIENLYNELKKENPLY